MSSAARSADVLARVRAQVVGREREVELILAAVSCGRDLLLEGPPGTSKTTLLKAITSAWGIPLIFAEGNAELTPGRLLGHHDPARVLREGYGDETFEPGPLVEAMREGGFLYLEEFNRAPEDTLNTLLTAIADRCVTIPRVGTVEAAPTFRVIGSMNPFDHVGTTRLSVSIKDRFNRLVVDYQDVGAEADIVRLRCADALRGELGSAVVVDAVTLTRATRSHPAVTQGSSVRGAIDLALIAAELGSVRGVQGPAAAGYAELFWDAMLVALSGRISLDHAASTDERSVLREIWAAHFGVEVEADLDATAEAPSGKRGPEVEADRSQRPFRVKPKELDHEPALARSAGGGGLAAAPPEARREPRRNGATGFTEESAALDDEEGEPAGPNLEVRARARQIAADLSLLPPPPLRRPPRGGEDPRARRYAGEAGEIDLERTLESSPDLASLRSEDVLVVERRRERRRIVLVVDVSGSMRGERALTAAATVGALSAGARRDELAVIAFWSDAAMILRRGERAPLERLVDEMLGLETAGLTNVSFPLECALAELGPGGRQGQILLLSDCVHNAGPDPRPAAARAPRLDVLFDVGGERDSEMAADLARLGRGTVAPIAGHRDVAPALKRIFDGR